MEDLSASIINQFNNQSKNSLPSVGFLLKESFRIYKKYFWGLIGISIFLLLSSILGFFSDNPIYQTIVGIIGLIISFLVSIALIYAINAFIFNEQKIEITASWKAASSLIFPFIWLTILLVFITLGAIVPLIIPAIIITILLFFAGYSLIIENQRGLTAIVRSHQLMKGNWWSVLWRILIFSLLFGIPIGILMLILIFFLGAIFNQNLVEALLNLIINFLNIFIVPFSILYFYQLFSSLVKQKPLEFFNPQEKRGLYKGLAILGIVAIIIVLFLFIFLGFLLNRPFYLKV